MQRDKRRGSFEKGDKEYDEIEPHIAFETSLKTWAHWIDPNLTSVLLFMTGIRQSVLNSRSLLKLMKIQHDIQQKMSS